MALPRWQFVRSAAPRPTRATLCVASPSLGTLTTLRCLSAADQPPTVHYTGAAGILPQHRILACDSHVRATAAHDACHADSMQRGGVQMCAQEQQRHWRAHAATNHPHTSSRSRCCARLCLSWSCIVLVSACGKGSIGRRHHEQGAPALRLSQRRARTPSTPQKLRAWRFWALRRTLARATQRQLDVA